MATSLQYYSVSILNSITGSTPADGFIDSKRIENYYSSASYLLETTPSSFTNLLSLAKRRGNIRYHEIIRQLQLVSNFWIDPNTLTGTSGTSLVEPTVFSFQMVAPSGNWVTANESIVGTTLSGALCIKRCIARGLTADIFRQADIFDPTSAVSLPATNASVPRYGTRINVASSFEIGPYASSIAAAEALITVGLLH